MSVTEKESPATDNMNGHRNAPEEVQIPVPWGQISGKWWGPKNSLPIVALHGWQDNAGTFDGLAELLSPKVAVLAIDMPGHGFSTHIPIGQFYYLFWDGVVILRRIVKYYKWDKVKLLGHSLGGAISFLYAASYPDEVEFLICLDIASPGVRDITKTAAITGDYIDKFFKYEALESTSAPTYTYEDMLDIVENAYNGSITKDSAEILMKRGVQPSHTSGQYYFSRDPRLKASLLGMLSMDLILAYASRITCAYLNIRAVPGMEFEQPDNYQKVLDQIRLTSKKYVYKEVDGTHHVHLNNPERVAPVIQNFISP